MSLALWTGCADCPNVLVAAALYADCPSLKNSSESLLLPFTYPVYDTIIFWVPEQWRFPHLPHF